MTPNVGSLEVIGDLKNLKCYFKVTLSDLSAVFPSTPAWTNLRGRQMRNFPEKGSRDMDADQGPGPRGFSRPHLEPGSI